MILAAQRDDRYFLLSEGDQGVVFDRLRSVVFPPMLFQSILAQGYWRSPSVPDAAAIVAEASKATPA